MTLKEMGLVGLQLGRSPRQQCAQTACSLCFPQGCPMASGTAGTGPRAGSSGAGSADLKLDGKELLYWRARVGETGGGDDDDDDNTGFLLSNYYVLGAMLSHFCIIPCDLRKALPTLE